MDDRDPQQNQRLGELVRVRRRELGLTQAELAVQIERSPSYVSALESGSIAPSLMTLRQIASALGTVVAYFFEEQGAARPSGASASNGQLRVVRPATRKVLVDPARGSVRWELLSPDLRRQMEVVHMTMAPGAVIGEEGWLIHEGEECGVVLSGCLEIEFENERFKLESGDSLYFPSTRPHRIHNCHPGPTTAIWVITPPSF